MNRIDYEEERELAHHFDLEYELGHELLKEIIPFATEYFMGIAYESLEYETYVNERMIEKEIKRKKK